MKMENRITQKECTLFQAKCENASRAAENPIVETLERVIEAQKKYGVNSNEYKEMQKTYKYVVNMYKWR